RTWRPRSGKREVSSSRASAIVAALQSSFGAPSVKRRKAVGISMVTGIRESPWHGTWSQFSANKKTEEQNCVMFFRHLRFGTGRGCAEPRIEVSLERLKVRGDRFGGREFRDDGVGGLQAVASDRDDGGFMRLDAPLGDQFLRDAGGHAAGGFGEDAFGFGEELDGGYDLGIGDVFGPAAGVPDLVHRKRAVGRI